MSSSHCELTGVSVEIQDACSEFEKNGREGTRVSSNSFTVKKRRRMGQSLKDKVMPRLFTHGIYKTIFV